MGTLKVEINRKGLRIANIETIYFGQKKVSYKDVELPLEN